MQWVVWHFIPPFSGSRVTWDGNIAVENCSDCCMRWYITINDSECTDPGPIDAAIRQDLLESGSKSSLSFSLFLNQSLSASWPSLSFSLFLCVSVCVSLSPSLSPSLLLSLSTTHTLTHTHTHPPTQSLSLSAEQYDLRRPATISGVCRGPEEESRFEPGSYRFDLVVLECPDFPQGSNVITGTVAINYTCT